MGYRHALLAGSVSAIALAVAGSAFAQDAQEPATTLDEVVVTGLRASLQVSLDTKRRANAIVDVVTAEDVGQFPSSNVAEAITIIPGVTIDRQFGQGEKVSILGTDPALNRTLLNGQTVASADWFILDQPGRTFNYALLAPQIVGDVRVYKSPEARIDEGSIGGTVIVNTRRPLDRGLQNFAGGVTYLYNDRSGEGDIQASGLLRFKTEDGTAGILISAQRASDFLRRDGIQSYGTVKASDYAPSLVDSWKGPAPCTGTCAATLAANPNAVGLNALGTSYFEQERVRDSYMVALQWRPSEAVEVNFDWLRIDASYDNTNQSMFAFQGNTWNALDRLTGLTVEDGIIKTASFDNALSVWDIQYREAAMVSDSYRLQGDWRGENYTVSGQVGYTKATGGTQRQLFGEFLNWSNYSVDISGAPGRPGVINYPVNIQDNASAFAFDGGWGSGDPAVGPANWNSGWGGNIVSKPTTDSETYAQVDVTYDLEGLIEQVQFGYKYRDHETDQKMSGVSIPIYGNVGNASLFNPRRVASNYLEGFNVTPEMRSRVVMDGAALADYLAAGRYLRPWQSAPQVTTFGNAEFTAQNWNIQEAAHAFYGQANFSTERMRGNVGMRYVRTESDSGGYTCINQLPAGGCGTTAADWQWVVASKSYDNWLPSLNVAFDLTDNLILRGAAAKVIARPNFSDMSNYFWLSDQILTGGGGNPDLEPYESLNLNLSLEWYFAEGAILGGELFYKDIDNYILQATSPEQHYNQARQAITTYQISRPTNAGSAQVQGLSIAYQQNIAYGFGVLANYTYVDAESDRGGPLPFSSDHQLNFSPFYESGPFTARLAYSWRSEYFTGVDRANNMYVAAQSNLDATASWAFNENVNVTLAAQNLLDTEYYNYADVEALPRGVYRSGRKLMLTLGVEF